MWLMFQFVFTLGKYPVGWLEIGFEKIGVLIGNIITHDLIRSLIVGSIIEGRWSDYIHSKYDITVSCYSYS